MVYQLAVFWEMYVIYQKFVCTFDSVILNLAFHSAGIINESIKIPRPHNRFKNKIYDSEEENSEQYS
jgi:hypothetical protein